MRKGWNNKARDSRGKEPKIRKDWHGIKKTSRGERQSCCRKRGGKLLERGDDGPARRKSGEAIVTQVQLTERRFIVSKGNHLNLGN